MDTMYHVRMKFLIRYLIIVVAVVFTVQLVPGISAPNWLTILLAALVWSLIVSVIRPILTILTLPINILTLGIFSLILNALLFYAITWVVPSFHIAGVLPAFLGALVLSLVSWLLHLVVR